MKQKLFTIIIFSIVFIQVSKAQEKVLTANVGHTDDVTSVAYSPNGKYIISESQDGVIKLWNSETGQEIRTFKVSNNGGNVVFTPDGEYIVAYDIGNKTMKKWNIKTGKEFKIFKGDNSGCTIDLSPNGKYIATPVHPTEIELWDIKTGQKIRTFVKKVEPFSGFETTNSCLAFSPDGKYIASGYHHGTIQLWETETGQEIKTIEESSGAKSVIFSPDGKYIAGAFFEGIRLWDIKTGKEIRLFQTSKNKHKKYKIHGVNSISCIAFSPDGNYIIGGNTNNTIALWDINKKKQKIIFMGHTHSVNSVAFSPDGKYIVSGSDDCTIKLWNSQTGEEIRTLDRHIPKWLEILDFSPNGKYIASEAVVPRTFELFNQSNSNTFKIGYFLGFSPDEKYFVTAKKNTIKLCYSETGKEMKEISFPYSIDNIAFSPKNKYLAVSSENEIKLLNLETGKVVKTFIGHKEDINSLAFNSDGKYMVSGSDNSIKLWNVKTGQEIKTFKGNGQLCVVKFGHNDKYIVAGTQDIPSMSFWIIESGREIKMDVLTYNGYSTYTHDIDFSPDGKYIVTGHGDNTLRLRDTKTIRNIRTFNGHSSEVVSVAFIADGKYIISGERYHGCVKLWNTNTGDLILTMQKLKDSEDWVATTPDGRFDGTEKGMELLYYVQGLDIIPLSSLYEQYYTPNLLARVLEGEEFEEPEIKIADIKLPPLVEITSPKNDGDLRGFKTVNTGELKSANRQITVTVKATDQGGGIDEMRLYLNGKLVETTQRGFKPIEQKNDTKTRTFNISLTNGKNVIKATAFSNQRTESNADEITVFYEAGTTKTSNLHVLIIGIDNYKNPRYKLNYAIADASAFKEEIEKGSQSIFGSVNITYLKDSEADRENILKEFKNLQQNAGQEDVFIFYYSGHGVMREEKKSQFYIIPYDVTQLYGNNDMLSNKAISAAELQTFSTELKAQKQMFVFDACQSGGIVESFAAKGAAEEKAIAQLARSTGTYWLSASNSNQFATEFATLGHGVFTYSVLLGLQGQADGGNKDKKVTVKELSAFVEDKVPELSEKHKGEAQYPSSYGYGQDFPIVIVK